LTYTATYILLFDPHIYDAFGGHYPAITPKCIITTWSIGVKCLIRSSHHAI